ncbi:MAG: hypothetical protein HY835_02100, partial [Anaerolineae bacterium]|nr:hypothetical protein [Anaerolineae bacterium]
MMLVEDPALFDITIDPVFIEAGQDSKETTGLYAATAPRRSERLRAQDRVVFLFSQSGSALLAPNVEQEMLSRLSETFFSSPGSVTSGMRATVERLNDFLLNRNLRGARQGGALSCSLVMVVLHSASLYVLLAGPAHVYWITGGRVEHTSDAGSRGLGQARMVNPRFATFEAVPGARLLLSSEALGHWTDSALINWAAASAERQRTQLVGDSLNVQAAALLFEDGKGELRWTTAPAQPVAGPKEPRPATRPQAAPRQSLGQRIRGIFLSGKTLAQKSDDKAPADTAAPEPAAVNAAAIPPVRSRAVLAGSEELQNRSAGLNVAPVRRPVSPVQADGNKSSQIAEPAVVSEPKPASRAVSAFSAGAARAGSQVMGGMRTGWGRITDAGSKLVARALPGKPTDGGLNLSPSTMLFIALVVPLVVVSIAVVVYFQRGRGEQYQVYFSTARRYAEQAAAQQDVVLKREDWTQSLAWMQKANEYGGSEEGDALMAQAQASLDELDQIKRLAYQPIAIGELPQDVVVTRIVSTLNDAYLLDSTQGRVFRLYRTGGGFELDPSFNCGPGKAGAAIIGPLLDIVPLPPNNDFRATVMGVDAGGNLVYCAPNVTGFSSTMLIPPDAGWGEIKRMVIYQDELYMLDPAGNAVYRYYGSGGANFSDSPRLFFDTRIPTMLDVIDIAADQEFIYLLHEDGSMTTCTDSGFNVECTEPAPFGDTRAGRPEAPIRFEDANFVRLQATQPPDPSLYILDSDNAAVYHFSLRKLNLQQQYRAPYDLDYPLPDTRATA